VLGSLDVPDIVAARRLAEAVARGLGVTARIKPAVGDGESEVWTIAVGSGENDGAAVGVALTVCVLLDPPKTPRKVVLMPCGRK
jgi:hypothetical protein